MLQEKWEKKNKRIERNERISLEKIYYRANEVMTKQNAMN